MAMGYLSGMAESEETDVEKVAARFEHEADDLQRRNDEVRDHIETTRQDWQSKRGDSSVPGAVPEEPDEDAESADDAAAEATSEDADEYPSGPG
jgi:hypothetical protein